MHDQLGSKELSCLAKTDNMFGSKDLTLQRMTEHLKLDKCLFS